MSGFFWELWLAILGVLVSLGAALWEFVLVGRKRLGYRVQMDTTAEEVRHKHKGAWENLSSNSKKLKAPSFVLLRIENNGRTNIDTSDYSVPDEDAAGIEVTFPEREVAGVMITEINGDTVHRAFAEKLGALDVPVQAGSPTNVVELPRVSMNRGEHYKVLVVLEGPDSPPKTYPDPLVRAALKGGRFQETRSRTGPSKRGMALIGFLVAVILGQLALTLTEERTPLDCASGGLTLAGSTAFAPVLREAADSYAATCPDASFEFGFRGSGDGLEAIDNNGGDGPPMVAFSDGAKRDRLPMLLPRSIAFSLFTFVINENAGVADLSTAQVRDLYAGRITNWRQVGGRDLPVSLVSREPGSGSRRTVQERILEGKREAETNSDDCQTLDPGGRPGVIRCERRSTDDLLTAVANTPGALGYSELGAAVARDDVRQVAIDGQPATLDAADQDAYPLWQTEYAYTFGEPAADSLAASFLRYLTNEVGKDIIRSHGHRPCAELANPVLCRPVAG